MTNPTVANLKALLDVSGAGEDTELGWAIDGAIAWLEQKTGRVFVEPVADVEVSFPVARPFVRGNVLWLGRRDLGAITSVTNGNEEVVSSSSYYLLPIGGPYRRIVLRPQYGVAWTAGSGKSIVVDGRWYYTKDCPKDVFDAELMLAQFWYLSILSGPGGAVAGRMGEFTVNEGEIPVYVKQVVRDRRRL